MKIETKYNIGDKIWVYYEGKPTQCLLFSIIVFGCDDIEFIVSNEYGNTESIRDVFREYQLFSTKEELLKSL